jgi:methyl-accepting chemotaxis protein
MSWTPSTRSKLLLLIAVMALGSALVGAVGLIVAGKMERQQTRLSAQLLPSLQALAEVQNATAEIRFWSTRALVLASQGQLTKLDGPWTKREEARARGEKGLALLGSLELEPSVRTIYEQIEPAYRWMIGQNGSAWERMRDGDTAGTDRIMAAYSPKVQADLAEPMARGMALQLEISRDIQVTTATLTARARALLWGVLLASIVGGVALGLLLARSVARSLRVLTEEAQRMREAVAEGKLGTRAELGLVSTEFQPILAGVNETMDAYAAPIEVAVDHVTRIARGDIPPPITAEYKGDFNHLKDGLNQCSAALSGLLSSMREMAERQEQGDIDSRVDAARFQGAYRALAENVNGEVDLHVRAMLEILEVLRAYAEGDFTPVLRRFPGKQIVANERMDLLRHHLKGVLEQVRALTRSALDGRLSVRADPSSHRGEWKELVTGLNELLDAVVKPLEIMTDTIEKLSRGEIAEKISGTRQGDFVRMRDSVNRCIEAIDALVEDANGLADSAVAGALNARGDAARHKGEYRRIVDGVNRTLDAVTAPVQEAAQVLARLAERDLCARVQGDYRGDHAKIQQAVNGTATALHDAMAQVAQAADQVSSAATQIATSSQAVASGASEQAAALQETNTSLEGVSQTTKHTAESAQEADQLARTARAAAGEGSAAVEQMQGAMARIKASAEGTSQIIRDINDIAFQTNLLALNAAVEAARAGEAGRGFAVVAEEVRSLALRAKEAASKTEELIRQSVQEAGQGVVTAGQVASKLTEIAGGVSKVTDIVAEIAAAAREQSAGTQQVTRAIGEMDKVTQQNAASAEESSSAASELSGQAEELAAMVAAFQLAKGATRSRGALASAGGARRPQALPRGPGAAAPSRGGSAQLSARSVEQEFPLDAAGEVSDF